MSFLENMETRYSTKQYDSTKTINNSVLEELQQIVRLAPSSINSQPWKFTFISNKETKAKLAAVSMHNEEKINQCDTLVVFSRVENILKFEREMEAYVTETGINYYKQVADSTTQNLRRAWFEKQIYIALGVLLSACAQMGIDSTPMEGIEAEKYNAILGDQDFHAVVALAIGYRDEHDYNQPSKKPKSRKPLEQVVRVIK